MGELLDYDTAVGTRIKTLYLCTFLHAMRAHFLEDRIQASHHAVDGSLVGGKCWWLTMNPDPENP